jgi:hypothetical protein
VVYGPLLTDLASVPEPTDIDRRSAVLLGLSDVEPRHGAIDPLVACSGRGNASTFDVPFYGGHVERSRAFAAAAEVSLPVLELHRTWPILDGAPTGPCRELTFGPPWTERFSG